MKKFITFIGLSLFLVTAGGLSFAQQSNAPGAKGNVPSGFSQGEKQGWQSEFPPGWENKSEKEKKRWNDDVQKRKKNVLKAAKKKGLSEAESQAAADDFEKSARKGVAAKKAEAVVKKHLKKSRNAQELSASVAQESQQIVDEKVRKENQAKEKNRNKSGKR